MYQGYGSKTQDQYITVIVFLHIINKQVDTDVFKSTNFNGVHQQYKI